MSAAGQESSVLKIMKCFGHWLLVNVIFDDVLDQIGDRSSRNEHRLHFMILSDDFSIVQICTK